MLKQKYFLTGIFILSAERQPIKLAWRKIVWLQIKGMPMLRDFSFAQPQGQESGLAQVFMQFAMHNNHKL